MFPMDSTSLVKIIECPRDAMQGLTRFIPTDVKIRYINQLLQVGFDTLDMGSFVSPKAIPQMRDTAQVLAQINLSASKSKLLTIIANSRGAHDACHFEAVDYLGFPLSLSETFQYRNTNKSIAEAFEELTVIHDICQEQNKKLVVYLSMGFGNPYGDTYDPALIHAFVEKLDLLGVRIISLADTIGAATPESIDQIYTSTTRAFPHMEIGVHLHASPQSATDKIKAAIAAGCRRIDGAIHGFGGCPMADDKLVGNIATESIIHHLEDLGIASNLSADALSKAMAMAPEVFVTQQH